MASRGNLFDLITGGKVQSSQYTGIPAQRTNNVRPQGFVASPQPRQQQRSVQASVSIPQQSVRLGPQIASSTKPVDTSAIEKQVVTSITNIFEKYTSAISKAVTLSDKIGSNMNNNHMELVARISSIESSIADINSKIDGLTNTFYELMRKIPIDNNDAKKEEEEVVVNVEEPKIEEQHVEEEHIDDVVVEDEQHDDNEEEAQQ